MMPSIAEQTNKWAYRHIACHAVVFVYCEVDYIALCWGPLLGNSCSDRASIGA